MVRIFSFTPPPLGPAAKPLRCDWPRRRPIRVLGCVRVCNWRLLASSHTPFSLLRPCPTDHYPQQCFFSFSSFSAIVIGVSPSERIPLLYFLLGTTQLPLSGDSPFPSAEPRALLVDLCVLVFTEITTGAKITPAYPKVSWALRHIMVHLTTKRGKMSWWVRLRKRLLTTGRDGGVRNLDVRTSLTH